jgi:mono/diheme cytochrome c family protein
MNRTLGWSLRLSLMMAAIAIPAEAGRVANAAPRRQPMPPANGAAPPGPNTPAPQAAWDLRWMAAPPRAVAPSKPPRRTDRLNALGASLYHSRCASCHGDNGDGKGPMAPRLNVPPTSFIAGVYKLRSTPSGSIPTDSDLFTTITRGVHGTPMLPWTDLREEERWALVFHLQSLSVRFHEERPVRPISVPPAPVEDAALREKGRRLYATLQCTACHGEKGMANGSRANLYRSPSGQLDVHIRDFSRGRFIRGTEMKDIYLTLRVGLEGTPMASYDALADGDIWALAAYVRSLIRERPIQDLPPAGHSIN